MPKFEVGGERKRLCHRNVAPSLEHHHRDRASRQHVPDDEFGNDVETDLLIRDSLDHADGDDIDEC